MPTAMHFFNRQYWHRFLLILRMAHCWFFVQGLYCIFCCMDRRKKPCGSQRQLVSRSTSEPSSLEQPESLDSRRASSMLTSTECLSRNSAPAPETALVPQDISRTIHYHWLPTSTTTLLVNRDATRTCNKAFAHCTDVDGGRQRTVRVRRRAAHSYPRDLLAGRRPNRESESAPGPLVRS